MSQFSESDHPRGSDGKFEAKGPAAEDASVELSASPDAEFERNNAKMQAFGNAVATHHPDAETVIINSGEVSYEDYHGHQRMLSDECRAEVDQAIEGFDRTDPEVWEKFAEDYDAETAKYQFPDSMIVGEDERMVEARMPVSYLQDGYPEETDEESIDSKNMHFEQQIMEEGR